ncbi:MAG: FKBP-type peptidyl-prolyl cis-trans isomerase [Chitinophagales bacterium]|nr:FKBP-type peptidyl-prolyl cis-trans isomerase [Chitinophagales bacterium]MCZ2394315.1 FKBP-type peptidyl-prolyl cis-trans isomerase [Chitinophagales bacterium]
MKKNIIFKSTLVLSILTAFTVFFTSCSHDYKKPAKIKLTNDKDSLSYILGGTIVKSYKMNQIDTLINIEALVAGIQNEFLNKFEFTDEQIQTFFEEFQRKQFEKTKSDAISQGPSKEEEDFLNENAKKPGVITTNSGLQYEIIKEGTGPKPNAKSEVEVHYVGTLLDGKEFDSSIKRGESVKFVLNQVIPGWTEGVQLMNVGSKYKFYIPSNLAYGTEGAPQGGIGPNETLIFEIELLSFK